MTTINLGHLCIIRVAEYVHVADDVQHTRVDSKPGEAHEDAITIRETNPIDLAWEDGDVWITLATWRN